MATSPAGRGPMVRCRGSRRADERDPSESKTMATMARVMVRDIMKMARAMRGRGGVTSILRVVLLTLPVSRM